MPMSVTPVAHGDEGQLLLTIYTAVTGG
uniref:Uncharacterized protein n=1 Tax=Anguilla anguilla TaxID=7936 RepID=A0A0E9RQM0_ANGAN